MRQWVIAKNSDTSQKIFELLQESRLDEPERFRRAPLPHPREFDESIDHFVAATKLAFAGEVQEARHRMGSIDHMPMVKWYDEIAQHVGDVRYELIRNYQPYRKRAQRDKKRDMGDARMRRLAERDGYRCGYCGIRVVEPAVLKKVQSELGRDVFPSKTGEKGSSNLDYHGIWLVMAITLDHIKPFAIDADDSDGNLVTCCWGCNFGKYDYTLDELGLLPPSTDSGVLGSWLGLRDVV
jgi:5-methylcytosine-specific restriction endonuclease McrA